MPYGPHLRGRTPDSSLRVRSGRRKRCVKETSTGVWAGEENLDCAEWEVEVFGKQILWLGSWNMLERVILNWIVHNSVNDIDWRRVMLGQWILRLETSIQFSLLGVRFDIKKSGRPCKDKEGRGVLKYKGNFVEKVLRRLWGIPTVCRSKDNNDLDCAEVECHNVVWTKVTPNKWLPWAWIEIKYFQAEKRGYSAWWKQE